MDDAWLYLDNNATTPCDPRVVEKMLPFFSQIYGNPANGLHRQGRKAGQAVDEAREQVAALIGARPGEIVFTSGATESNNLAILGLARSKNSGNRKKIVVSSVEHKSVLTSETYLSESGFKVVKLPVDSNGVVSLESANELIDSHTLLLSIQAANNEVGTMQPIVKLAEMAHNNGAYFHCDCAQSAGKVLVNVNSCGAALLSLSGHKIYGPKGIGALFIRGGMRQVALEPLVYGGGQENGLRPGTLNVPGMVGFGEACSIANQMLIQETDRIAELRNQLEEKLSASIPGLQINARNTERLPNTSSLTFEGVDADALILNLESVMVGTGSACSSGAIEPSHVLTAMGLPREQAFSTVRISLGRFNNRSSVDQAVQEICRAYKNLRVGEIG